MNPTMKVVKIQPARILAGSQEDVKVGSAYTKGGTVLGRQGSFSGWNEEEE